MTQVMERPIQDVLFDPSPYFVGERKLGQIDAGRLFVPCSDDNIREYVRISDIMASPSIDFLDCYSGECEINEYGEYENGQSMWCEHNMDYKRQDHSYDVILNDLDSGLPLRNAVQWNGEQGNGHHRVIAAYDLGFTWMPVSDSWGNETFQEQ